MLYNQNNHQTYNTFNQVLSLKYFMQISHKSQYATNAYYKISLVVIMNRLKDLREDKDLTQEKLANMLNCSQSTYSRYEKGELNIPVDVLKKLSKFYKVTIDYILKNSNTKN